MLQNSEFIVAGSRHRLIRLSCEIACGAEVGQAGSLSVIQYRFACLGLLAGMSPVPHPGEENCLEVCLELPRVPQGTAAPEVSRSEELGLP